MKIGIISGSHRKKSQSRKVADFMAGRMIQMGQEIKPWLLDLAEANFPMWDEGVWSGEEKWKKIWSPVAQELSSCDGFVVISPEWSGMATPALKNFFLLASSRELGHKPGLIVTVSSGMGGSFPVNEIRTSGYKNTRICYLPEHLVIRNIEKLLNVVHDTDVTPDDQYIRGRIDYAIRLLAEYAKGLKMVRDSGQVDHRPTPTACNKPRR